MLVVWFILTVGALLFVLGLSMLKSSSGKLLGSPRVMTSSVLLCALSFNLTFIWQELWLVIPKAMTPGLHPILYHNDHQWMGGAPVAELLQGTGAIATLVSGLAFLGALIAARRLSLTWRLFLFWMAFQGLYQSLTQVAVGALIPGNDVGRALAYLQATQSDKWAMLGLASVAMAVCGAVLARFWPVGELRYGATRSRAFAVQMMLSTMISIVLIIPFRMPRNVIEVALVPLMINLMGLGWVIAGAAVTRGSPETIGDQSVSLRGATAALGLVLLVFQVVLRPGVAF